MQKTRINDLTTGFINQLPVDTFVTLQTDQTIAADVMFKHFLTLGITANSTNGIRFGEDVVVTDGGQYIESKLA